MVAGLVYYMMPKATSSSGGATETTVVPPDAGARASTALVDETLDIPDEVPDAWVELPDAGAARAPTRRPIVVGSWDCTGDLDRSAITSTINEYRPQIQACYERRLKQNNLLQGNLQLQLRVAQSGNVDAVQVGGSLRDREVFSCVRNIAARMRFPRVTGGDCAVVSVPFAFTPRQ